jgi:hypothetical protein
LPAGSVVQWYKLAIIIEKVDAGDSPLGAPPARQHDAGLRIKELEGRDARGSALPWFYWHRRLGT